MCRAKGDTEIRRVDNRRDNARRYCVGRLLMFQTTCVDARVQREIFCRRTTACSQRPISAIHGTLHDHMHISDLYEHTAAAGRLRRGQKSVDTNYSPSAV